MNIATNDSTGEVIQNATSAPAPDWTLQTDMTIPARPAGMGRARLLWQSNALTWVGVAATPQQTFAAAVAAGFTYTVPGIAPALTITLDLSDGARAQFTGLVVLIQASMAAGQILSTSTQAIADQAGTLHALPVSEIIPMLLAYGAYYAGLFNALHAATTNAAPAPAAAPAS